MAENTNTTRRAVLKAAPAVAIAAAVPAVAAAAAGESEIEQLFRQWDAHAYRTGEIDIDGIVALEEQIAATPATSLRDLAMKLTVWTAYGEAIVSADHMDGAMIAEMLAVAGVERPVPAGLVAGLEAAGTHPVKETEVERRFREWKQADATVRANTTTALGLSRESVTREYEDGFDQLVIEEGRALDRVLSAPSQGPRDTLHKVAARLTYASDPQDKALVAEVRNALGLTLS